jgi:hypothetical protein
VVTWNPVDDGGSPLTSFIILIGESDGVTFTESGSCDGSDPTILASATCSFDVSVVRNAPYSLEWGASVFAKVVASNIYGSAEASVAGNGAKITTYPDAPTDLIEDYSQRTPTVLAFSWTPPLFTGGDDVLDYRVSIAVQGESFTEL